MGLGTRGPRGPDRAGLGPGWCTTHPSLGGGRAVGGDEVPGAQAEGEGRGWGWRRARRQGGDRVVPARRPPVFG